LAAAEYPAAKDTAMPAIAKVVVDIALDREFDYRIPRHLAGRLCPGSRVVVPFGKSTQTGYVVGLSERSKHGQLKEVTSIEGKKPLLDDDMLKLARWMAEYYCAPVEKAIRAVLPGAVRRRGSRFKNQAYVTLPEAVDGVSPGSKKPLPAKQQAVLDVLMREHGGMFLSVLTRTAGVTASPVRALEKKGIVAIAERSMLRDPLANRNILRTQPLTLMPEQAEALVSVKSAVSAQNPSAILLYGVTGSGKTEVYLQAISHVLERGQGAIVLVPEIALTPQTVERFVGRFGKRIAVLHSHLSDGERHDEWHRIHDGKADIVIGARSAVFAPVANLGLIVVDEEHEPSYKQEEAPCYSARDVAVMRGHMQKCAVILGSATPALESWNNALRGKYGLSRLPHRADNRRMPSIKVVDMRLEAERAGGAYVFSRELLEAMGLRLERGEQTILFLNRRGYSTSLICRQCGFVASCENCSVSFTYHRRDERLRCHICGDSRTVPPKCPECFDPGFKYTGVGTQRVETIVRKCFPQAVIARMDADATTNKDAYDRILGDFRAGKTHIMIGTQMIAKGLHFPNVTLVGVVYADLSLHMPDFRAGERTFQLLAQVAGRAGRGDVSGEVIVQTHTPFSPAVQAARRVDFEGFCDQELEFRRELSYPPFAHLVCLTLRGKSEEQVALSANALARQVRQTAPAGRFIISEPAPAPLSRARSYYRYQLMLRGPSTRAMTQSIKVALAESTFPKGVACTVDVDALSLM
jgi:primosomal protein N' (replication factor Y) (superfamily II helicase)